MRPYLDVSGPIAFAHRGGARLWPENTQVAFEGALSLGYRYIETDLHMTRDGVLVCFHDDRVDRTTNGSGHVWDYTLSELQALDAGYRFVGLEGDLPFRGQGARVPTLEEALALSPELRLNVEIKQRRPPMVRALFRLIERLGVHDRLLVAAADDRVGWDFRRVSGGAVAMSPGYAGVLRFWLGVRTGLHRLQRYGFDALQVPIRYRGLTVVDRPFVQAAHAHGLAVHVWTVDDPDSMRELLDLGVDGIMTDRPEVLSDVLHSDR